MPSKRSLPCHRISVPAEVAAQLQLLLWLIWLKQNEVQCYSIATRQIVDAENPSNHATSPSKTVYSATAYDSQSRVLDQGYPSGYVVRNVYSTSTASPGEGNGDLHYLKKIVEHNSLKIYDTVAEATTAKVHWQYGSQALDGHAITATVGGQSITYDYDPLGRTKSITTAGSIQSGSYGFDLLGNLTSRQDASNGLNAETYGYDLLNRVIKRGTTTIATYDNGGSILTREGITGSYVYQANTHRVSTVNGNTYAYDVSGNVSTITASNGSQNKTLSGYTAFNLPTQITSTVSGVTNTLSYTYGAGHERIKEVSSTRGTTYMFGGYEIHTGPASKGTANTSATSNITELRHILPAGLGVVTLPGGDANGVGAWTPTTSTGAYNAPSNTATDSAYRYHFKDYLGSIVAITDGNGNVKQRMKYNVWGTRDSIALTGDPYLEERGFTGHEHLDEVGLIHMNGRVYDPNIGRFLQADPIIQAPYDSQSYNRYSYVFNNPLSLTDPSGFRASWWVREGRQAAKLIVAVVVAYFTAGAASEMVYAAYGVTAEGAAAAGMTMSQMGAGITTSSGISVSAAAGAAGAAAGGFAMGGIMGGNIQSALKGAMFAVLTFGLAEGLDLHGGAFEGANGGYAKYFGQMAVHAAVGCAKSASSGGHCREGALGGAVGAFFDPALGGMEHGLGRAMANGMVGGMASVAGGGKFENGFLSAITGYMYNAAGLILRGFLAISSAYLKNAPAINTTGVAVAEAALVIGSGADVPSVAPLGAVTKAAGNIGDATKDAAKILHNSGVERGVVAEIRVTGMLTTDASGSVRTMNNLHPELAVTIDRTNNPPKAPWHGYCAEVACLNNLLNAGINPRGGSSYAIDLRTMQYRPACISCQRILGEFGVKP